MSLAPPTLPPATRSLGGISSLSSPNSTFSLDPRTGAPLTTPLTSDQQHILAIITPVSATLGLVGALATILLCLFHRHVKTTTARVIFCMAVADLIGVIPKAVGRLGPDTGGALCQAQAAIMQYGDLASILWTAVVAFNLVMVMLLDRAVSQLRRFEMGYFLAAFLVPLPFALIPLFLGHREAAPVEQLALSSGATIWLGMYGDADLWCWIHPSFTLARLLLFYAPLWIVFCFNTVTFALVGRRIWAIAAEVYARHGPNAAVHDRKYQYGRSTSLFLIAFLVTWTPSTVNRLYAFVYPTHPSFILTVIMAICSPARGMINFAVYFYLTWFSQVKWDSTRGGEPAAAGATTTASSSGDEAISWIVSLDPYPPRSTSLGGASSGGIDSHVSTQPYSLAMAAVHRGRRKSEIRRRLEMSRTRLASFAASGAGVVYSGAGRAVSCTAYDSMDAAPGPSRSVNAATPLPLLDR